MTYLRKSFLDGWRSNAFILAYALVSVFVVSLQSDYSNWPRLYLGSVFLFLELKALIKGFYFVAIRRESGWLIYLSIVLALAVISLWLLAPVLETVV